MNEEQLGNFLNANSESLHPKVHGKRRETSAPSFKRASAINGRTEMKSKGEGKMPFLEDPTVIGCANVIARATSSLSTRNGVSHGTMIGPNVMVVNAHAFATASHSRECPVVFPMQRMIIGTNNTSDRSILERSRIFDPRNLSVQDFDDEEYEAKYGYNPCGDLAFYIFPANSGLPKYRPLTEYFLRPVLWPTVVGC
jgi:hypothetical protein